MDNDPKNTSLNVQVFIRDFVPYLIDWPSRSPDLNPVENVWKIFKQNVRKKLPQTLDELEDVIHQEWNFSR